MIRKGIHPSVLIDSQGDLTLPDDVIIEPQSVIYLGVQARLALGRLNTIYPHTTIRIDQGWMTTGDEVSFGPGVRIYEPRGGLTIGSYCLIGGGVLICGVQHDMGPEARPMRRSPPTAHPIVIGEDVWIGMGAIIGPGVTIGAGAVIGAGSVVVRDIPARAIAMGNPARVHRYRDEGAPPEDKG